MTSAADHDFGPLRSSIEKQFSAMSLGVQTNAEIAMIVGQLIKVATRTVLDCAGSWNETYAKIQLPDELLAECFALLPVRDRFSVAQVSQSWRCVALSFPSVWGHIELLYRARDSVSLFDAALARAGSSPVDLDCRSSEDSWFSQENLTAIKHAVYRHNHHLRSLSWYIFDTLPEFLSSGAPVPTLQSLETSQDFELPRDFLGGKPSSLYSLRVGALILPESCPALSTLTRLHCDIPETPGAEWRRLFDLCPRLESLTLRKLPPEMSSLLPSGPAPRTLVQLKLVWAICDLAGATCDLAALYIAWRTDRLIDVVIEAASSARWLPTRQPSVLQLSKEAAHTDVSLFGGEDRVGSLTMRAAASPRAQIVIILNRRHEDHVESFESLIRALPLDTVRSLSIDGVLLTALIERPLHALTHLTLALRRDYYTGDYPWKSLPVIPGDLPELQSVRVEVEPPVGAGDEPEIVAALIAICTTFPALTIDACGFPQHIVDELRTEMRADEIMDRVVFHV